MKSIASSVAAFVIAAAGLALAAAPAEAGLDFTDTATSASGGTGDFTFNGSTTIGTTVSMVNGFGGATNATVSSNLASGSGSATLARVVFSYTGAFNSVVAADWSVDHGSPLYNMVVEFGAITLGAGGSASLQAIEFDEGAGFQSVWNINQAITTADAFTKIHINVPSASIPLTERDLATAVRLTFLFTGGSGTAINLAAVANPEPGTIALFGFGLAGLFGAVRARRKSRARAKTA
jgi:PEP-CTERM motif